jgi:hypothetical protein
MSSFAEFRELTEFVSEVHCSVRVLPPNPPLCLDENYAKSCGI